MFFSRFFTSEQKSFAFSQREKSTADFITAHADIDLLACVDKTFNCFHFQSSEKIIPYSEHEKTPIVRRALNSVIHTHHSSITTLQVAGWCAVNELVSRALFIGWFQYNVIGVTCQHRKIVIEYFQKTLDSDAAS